MSTDTRRVLVVDDHVGMVELLAEKLEEQGYAVEVATSGADAIERIDTMPPDVVLTDLRMKGVDGFDVLNHARRTDPDIPVLVMTAFGDVATAVEAMKRGAVHYLCKPFQLDEVLVNVRRALETQHLVAANRSLRRLADEHASLAAIVGESAAIKAMRERILRVAAAPMPALVLGESGTGKELVARAIHFTGPRGAEPFVAVNCTTLPGNLLESELFGHARGAFTGADTSRRGLLVEADGGTLFLDEIGDMPSELQAKLLRVLETREFRPVGSDKTRRVDIRVVAATHRPLAELVSDGAFREDLYFRLNVLPVEVPPLRQRSKDVPLLVETFVARARAEHPSTRVRRFSSNAVEILEAQPWPGNVRQLANLVRRLVVLVDEEEVRAEHVREELGGAGTQSGNGGRGFERLMTLREFEDEYIEWVLEQCEGNKSRAAEVLGLDRATIHRRLKRSD